MILIDATGTPVFLPRPPRRIVSLFPSQTHLLAELGLDDEVVGITRFCKYPEGWKKRKRVVGGTKDVHIDRVAALEPDLILANKEENTREAVEALRQIAPVYVSEVHSWEDNLDFVRAVGILTGRENRARSLVEAMEAERRSYTDEFSGTPRKALYFIWRNPWMTAGSPTFIDTMMRLAGFENLTPPEKGRYPAWEEDELKTIDPEVILLCDEPFPFKPEKHLDEVRTLFPAADILFVRGEPFTWFGAYPLRAFDYFRELQTRLNHAH
ncbi:MAG: ABC transporter substrate-binding protein [Chlorobi bacterium]|nr:ABC transporter substrate-binding protein [Chlorobiota bacterium]